MNHGGDAAEQVVRMSLDGVEVAAKITGEGAKNIAILLYTILKDNHQTKGKARLKGMMRSGKELKVFTLQNKDLRHFQKNAKRYGILYCVLKDRATKDPNAEVDIIARAEDAPKITRIVEKCRLAATIDAATKEAGITEADKSQPKKKDPIPEPESPAPEEAEIDVEALIAEALAEPEPKTPEKEDEKNPKTAEPEKSPPSKPSYHKAEPDGAARTSSNSVRAEIERLRLQKKNRALATMEIERKSQPSRSGRQHRTKPLQKVRYAWTFTTTSRTKTPPMIWSRMARHLPALPLTRTNG